MTSGDTAKPFHLSDHFSSWKWIKPFAVGGTAGVFATMCVQPVDRLKTAIQAATIEGKTNRGALHVRILSSYLR